MYSYSGVHVEIIASLTSEFPQMYILKIFFNGILVICYVHCTCVILRHQQVQKVPLPFHVTLHIPITEPSAVRARVRATRFATRAAIEEAGLALPIV